jgi:hypothetical protein
VNTLAKILCRVKSKGYFEEKPKKIVGNSERLNTCLQWGIPFSEMSEE